MITLIWHDNTVVIFKITSSIPFFPLFILRNQRLNGGIFDLGLLPIRLCIFHLLFTNKELS